MQHKVPYQFIRSTTGALL